MVLRFFRRIGFESPFGISTMEKITINWGYTTQSGYSRGDGFDSFFLLYFAQEDHSKRGLFPGSLATGLRLPWGSHRCGFGDYDSQHPESHDVRGAKWDVERRA